MSSRAIEIIGGGLAGLALGIGLRRAGIAVTVHEAGDYPRHRVCGEFIAGLSTATIERLALAPALRDALPLAEVAWHMPGQRAQVQRLPETALGISRYTLDARLARTFVDAGGTLVTRSRISDHERVGRVVASGRRPARDQPWIGLKMHLRDLSLVRPLEMHLGRHCYVGLSQLPEGIVNVCGLFRRRAIRGRGPALLLDYLRAGGLESLAIRLARAVPQPDSVCAVAALGFDRRVVASNRMCLGDAGAAIPPFTGNGMAMALQSAEVALAPLIDYAHGHIDWAQTCAVTHAALTRKFRLRLASAGVLHAYLLRPGRQRWLSALGRARLLPFRPLYAALH